MQKRCMRVQKRSLPIIRSSIHAFLDTGSNQTVCLSSLYFVGILFVISPISCRATASYSDFTLTRIYVYVCVHDVYVQQDILIRERGGKKEIKRQSISMSIICTGIYSAGASTPVRRIGN